MEEKRKGGDEKVGQDERQINKQLMFGSACNLLRAPVGSAEPEKPRVWIIFNLRLNAVCWPCVHSLIVPRANCPAVLNALNELDRNTLKEV